MEKIRFDKFDYVYDNEGNLTTCVRIIDEHGEAHNFSAETIMHLIQFFDVSRKLLDLTKLIKEERSVN